MAITQEAVSEAEAAPAGQRLEEPSGIAVVWGSIKTWILPAVGLAATIAVWQGVVMAFSIPAWKLPAPSAIAVELVASRALYWKHMWVTLSEVFLGFGFALAVGLTLALLVAYFRTFQRVVYPFIIASQTIPIIVVAPLLLIWVGYGITPKIIVVVLIAFFPIVVNAVDGLRSVDADMVNMMRTLGASRWQVFTKLQVPTSLPFMFSGIKIGISVSVIAAVIGEWVGASAGLGYLITYSQPLFLTARVFAAIVVLSVMGMTLFGLAALAERLLLPWYHTEKQAKALGRE